MSNSRLENGAHELEKLNALDANFIEFYLEIHSVAFYYLYCARRFFTVMFFSSCFRLGRSHQKKKTRWNCANHDAFYSNSGHVWFRIFMLQLSPPTLTNANKFKSHSSNFKLSPNTSIKTLSENCILRKNCVKIEFQVLNNFRSPKLAHKNAREKRKKSS